MTKEVDLDAVSAEIAAASARAFAAWDAELFQQCSQTFVHYFRWKLRGDPGQALVWRGLLQILARGIGDGYLRGGGPESLYESFSRQNLLGWCLARLVPQKLAELPAGQRLPALTTLWNLCEGLLGEPEWVQRYALSRAGEIKGFDDVEVLLYDALESAYAPAAPARWTGPLSVSCLDAREAHEGFLPGELYLAAPRVLCVADRRDPEQHTAIFLERGACRLMGPTGRLEPLRPHGDLPSAQLSARRLTLGERSIELPQIARPYSHAVTPGGFVAVSALDSQRLWVIESL